MRKLGPVPGGRQDARRQDPAAGRLMATAALDFTYAAPAARVVLGAGRAREVAAELDLLGIRRALVACTPSGVRRYDDIISALGGRCAVFAKAEAHCPLPIAQEALEAFVAHGADGIVTIGGGSGAQDFGKFIAAKRGAPLPIPTTLSGSEMTALWRQDRQRKAHVERHRRPAACGHLRSGIDGNVARARNRGHRHELPGPLRGSALSRATQPGRATARAGRKSAASRPACPASSSAMTSPRAPAPSMRALSAECWCRWSASACTTRFATSSAGISMSRTATATVPSCRTWSRSTRRRCPILPPTLPPRSAHAPRPKASRISPQRVGAPRSLRALGVPATGLRQAVAREVVAEGTHNPRPIAVDGIEALLSRRLGGKSSRRPTTDHNGPRPEQQGGIHVGSATGGR